VDQIKGNRRTFDAMLLALIEDCIHASGEFMQDGRGLLIFNQSSVLKFVHVRLLTSGDAI
jgi:hypothetical protein